MAKRDPQNELQTRRTRRGSGRVTLADVARAGGVSTQTVSRVVNSPATVPPATLAHVRAAIAEVGYVPNLLAGGLASGRSKLVAALIPTLASPVFLETLEALTQELAKRGYQLMLGESGYDDSDEIELFENLISRGPDGIVLTRIVQTEAARRRLTLAGIPVVETWDLTPTPVDMLIGFSHENVGKCIADLMIERGSRRPALISGDDPRAQRRKQGYAQRLVEKGILRDPSQLPQVEVHAPAAMGAGRAALSSLLGNSPDADAVYCSTDLLALGALIEARERGIKVPSDLAVVGFGDLNFAGDTSPSLTTVRIDGRAIGTLAADWIVRRASGEVLRDKVRDIGFTLVRRDSA